MKKHNLITFLFIFIGIIAAQSQIINTYVGNGTAGYSGDGGAATSAELSSPSGIIFDASGNLYIADAGNNRVRKVTPGGTISTVAGNGTAGFSGDGSAATSAELNNPVGVAIDGSGNIYIADFGNQRIRKVSTSGNISTYAGTGTAGFSGDGGAATSAKIHNPTGLVCDGSGNLYFADATNMRVREVNTSGIINTIAGNGTAGFSGDGGAATSAELHTPTDVSIDASGNLYISDRLNYRIRKVNASGTISTVAGDGTAGFSGDGSAATSAELNNPYGVVDASGNLYIADFANNRLRKVNSSSIISTLAGNGTAGFLGDGGQAISAELSSPTKPAIDQYGNLYFSDEANNRIRVVYLYLNTTASVSNNVSCHGGTNGSASSTPSEGTTPYTYSWSPGGNTNQNPTGLTAGSYTVTVTDNDGITGTASITITQPTSLSVSASAQNSFMCPSSSDSLFSSVSGGVPPYTYSWTPSGGLSCSTCQKVNSTPSTTTIYTLTVTDNNGCTATSSIKVNVSCIGDSCANPYTIDVDSCLYNISLSDSVIWFKFLATQNFVDIILRDPSDTIDGRITSVTLYSGSCGSLVSLKSVSFFPSEDSVISLADTGLISGNYYYVKATKSAAGVNDFSRFLSLCVLPNPLNPELMMNGYLNRISPPRNPDYCVADACGDIVSNGNFENLNVTCAYLNTIWVSTIYNMAISPADVSCWYSTDIDGDYFTSCMPPMCYCGSVPGCVPGQTTNVPSNWGGCTATDHSIVYGYAGPTYGYAEVVADYQVDGSAPPWNTYYGRTYLLQKLLGNMTIGRTYKVSFWVYLMPRSDGYINAADMGLLFTNTGNSALFNNINSAMIYDQIDPATSLPAVPQITGNCASCNCAPTFNSANTWVNITGLYTANGTENYVEIGNFNTTTAHTTTGSDLLLNQVSYYIDDVSITPYLTITGTSSVTCGPSNVTLTASTGYNDYLWAPGGATTSSITVNPATTTVYTVTASDGGSCTPYTATFTVTVDNMTASIGTPTDPLCHGGTGSATVTTSGGTSPYVYSWSPSGGTNATGTGLTAGNYTVTVTDNNGCTASASVSITQPATSVTAAMGSPTYPKCNGGTGSVTVTAGGGASPYAYSWSPSGGTGATGTGLTAGNYTVTVTDHHGCTATASVSITQPPALTATMGSPTDPACNGGTGSATVTAGGGTGAYTYSWSPTGGTNATGTGLTARSYTVTVKDNNGCSATASVTITQPSVVSGTFSTTGVSCNGGSTGSATVNPTGGTSPYTTYSWSPSSQTTQTATGLSAGTYTVTITDSHGCTGTASVTITQPAVLTATMGSPTYPKCNGGTGSVTVTAGGGTTAYTYSWSPSGGTGATGTGLTAGNYTVTVTDHHGCTATASVNITQPAVLTATMGSPTDPACSGGTGSATVTAGGGTGAYTYSWAPSGGTNATGTGLTARSYTVTVKDNNGCSATASVTITQPTVLTATISSHTNPLCNGGTGSSTVTAGGGTSPYTYSWAPSGGTNNIGTGLTAGNYTVTVTDNHGCTATASVTITQPTAVTATITPTYPLCNGQKGDASVTAGGGTGAYTYSWSPSGGTTANATGLSAGTYTVTVKDHNGCTVTASINITQPPALTTIITPVYPLCNGGGGTATVGVSGGTSPYTYLWNPSGQTLATATGLTIGTYTIDVTDNNGCSATASIAITQPSALTASVTITQPLCNGETGSASVTAGGGVSPYTYAWTPSGGSNATATGLSAGTYTVIVEDHNGCFVTASAVITQPAVLVPNASVVFNYDACNSPATYGSAIATPTGGSGAYTYSWNTSPTQTNQTATGLSAGNFTVTVTDNNGCSATASITITQVVCCSIPGVVLSESNFTSSSLTAFASGPAVLSLVGTTWVFNNFQPTSALEISGINYVNQNTEFLCSDVYMSTNAEIIVDNNSTLTIDGSHLHAGCGDMWNYIKVTPGSTLIVENNSLIEDAYDAVWGQSAGTNPSTLYLSNSIFNKNNVGVLVSPYGGTYPIKVDGCTFSCDLITGGPNCSTPWTVTTTPTSLIAPLNPLRGNFGIEMLNVNAIQIGGPSLGLNTFQDMNDGTYSYESSVTILHNYFYNFTAPPPGISTSGTLFAGVFARGISVPYTLNPHPVYNLNVGGVMALKVTSPCSFKQCNYGVYQRDSMNVTVWGNTIDGFATSYSNPPVCYGIFLAKNFKNTINILYNNLDNLKFGTINYRNENCTANITGDNVVGNTVHWPQSYGSVMVETQWNGTNYHLSNNIMSGISNGIGGKLLNSPYINVNTISITGLGTSTNFGIGLDICGTSMSSLYGVDQNIINYSGSNGSTMGIALNSSYSPGRGSVITCNHLNYEYNSIFINGPQDPIAIEGNYFNMPLVPAPISFGLHLNTAGNIGTSTTVRTNTWNTCTLINPTTPEATKSLTPLNSIVVPSGSLCTNDPPVIMNFLPGTRIAFYATGGPDTYVCGSPLTPRILPYDALFIINDSVSYPIYAQTSNWMAKHGLYYFLSTVDSSLADSSTVIKHFLDSTKTANLGKIIQIDRLLGDTTGVSMADLDSAQSLNNSLTSMDTAESMYHRVYNIMLAINMDSTANGLPQDTQITALQSIAALCPMEYGGGVFVARALLSQVDTTVYINSCEMGSNKDSIAPPTVCTDSSMTTIHIQNATASSLGSSFAHDTLKTIYINGYLTINEKVTLMGCNVNFGPSAYITIEPYDSLVLTQSTGGSPTCTHLHAGCGSMWGGIHIMPGGTLIANDGTFIEDADSAINVTGNTDSEQGIYQLTGDVLNRNYMDIYVAPCPKNYKGYADNCVFTCRNLSPCSYTGWLAADTATLLPPFAGYRTSIGMYLNQVDSMNIGTQNSFDNMDAGIYSYGGNVTVQKDTFENIAKSPDESPGALLTGIYALKSLTDSIHYISSAYNLVIGGLSNGNVFRNCGYGVWARDSINANISYNTFALNHSILEDGVVLYANANNTSSISHNSISNAYASILCYRNQFSQITVTHNTITGYSGFNRSYGIQALEGPGSTGTHYTIDSNTIGNTTNGIFAIMLNRSSIIGNNITVNGAGTLQLDNEGMYFAAPFLDVIDGNTISDSNNSGADGIRIEAGRGSNIITCNSISNVANGLVFGGAQSPNTFIDQNYLQGFHAGLYLHSSGDIGKQGTSAHGTTNSWNPYNDTIAPPYATFADSSSNPNGYSHFDVPSGGGPATYPYPDAVMNYAEGVAKSVSFSNGAGNDCYTCAGTGCTINNVTALLAYRIIHDSANYRLYPSASHWLEKNAFYKYLWQVDSSLAASYTQVKSFLDSTEGANMGMLEKINSLLADSSNSSGDATTAQLLCITVSNNSPDSVEAATLAVYEVAATMKMCGQGTPDAGEINLLQMYAPLCPYQYGTGVYMARGLLAPVDSTDYSNSCEDVYSSEHGGHKAIKKTKQQSNQGSNLTALVYPNPANTILNIALFTAPGQQSQLQGKVEYVYLYNQTGALIASYQLTNSITTVAVNSLAAGIYHYRIIDSSQKLIKSGKVVIER